jgi:hypothetical protein
MNERYQLLLIRFCAHLIDETREVVHEILFLQLSDEKDIKLYTFGEESNETGVNDLEHCISCLLVDGWEVDTLKEHSKFLMILKN